MNQRAKRLALLTIACVLVVGALLYSFNRPHIDPRIIGKWSAQPSNPSAKQFVFYGDGQCSWPDPRILGRVLAWSVNKNRSGDELLLRNARTHDSGLDLRIRGAIAVERFQEPLKHYTVEFETDEITLTPTDPVAQAFWGVGPKVILKRVSSDRGKNAKRIPGRDP